MTLWLIVVLIALSFGDNVNAVNVKCEDAKGEICSCRRTLDSKCHFVDEGNPHCEPRDSVCSNPKFDFEEDECVQPQKYYAFLGTLCQFKKPLFRNPAKACQIEKVILAVNLYGKEHTDVDKITYQADEDVPFTDEWKIREYEPAGHPKGISKNDFPLYTSTMSSRNGDGLLNKCVNYSVPVPATGCYQLGLKLLEPRGWYTPGSRGFNVRLNDILVLQEFDIVEFTKSPLTVIDVLLTFQVIKEGDEFDLKLKGADQARINNQAVPLSFCNSQCNITMGKIQASAFYVVKLVECPNKSSGLTTTETPTTPELATTIPPIQITSPPSPQPQPSGEPLALTTLQPLNSTNSPPSALTTSKPMNSTMVTPHVTPNNSTQSSKKPFVVVIVMPPAPPGNSSRNHTTPKGPHRPTPTTHKTRKPYSTSLPPIKY